MQSSTVVMTNGPVTNPPVMHIPPAIENKYRFSGRPTVYKLSMALLAVSIVLFTVGFAAPAWWSSEGLWMICSRGICKNSISFPYVAWFNAVRAMECLALAALIMCMIVEVYQDFCKSSTAEYFVVEILAIIGSIFSFIGVIIYGVKRTGIFESSRPRVLLGWGFGLTTAASCMILLCAVSICLWRKSPSPNNAERAYISSSMGQQGGYAGGYNACYVYSANNQSAQPYLYPATTSIGNQFSYSAMTPPPPYQKIP